MEIFETDLLGVMILKPSVYEDERGFFKEVYNKKLYDSLGIKENFVQDNLSFSTKNVLRGMHFQKKYPQGKLVSCSGGSVYDVILDINPKSPTFKKFIGIELTSKNHTMVWIPGGYAHGFCVLSDSAVFSYKCTDFHKPNDEGGIIWSDSEIKIEWPIKNPVISKKDASLPTLEKYLNET